jgi:hypothetical protein
MRPRVVAVFVLLTAVLGSLLTGASAAHAQGSDPVCRMTLLGTLEVICTVPADGEDRRIDFIQWTRNDAPLPQFDDIRQILVSCSPGETFVIGLTIGFDDPADGQSTGSTRFTCRGVPLEITSFACESFGDYGYASFYCDLYWEGGTEPHQVSVSSNGSQARRFNDFDNNHVSVSGQCDPYQDTYVSVSVFDAAGRRADANQNSFCPR